MVSAYPLAPITRAIEQHLASHPHAADSPAGVARWWLAASGVQATPDEVERALDALVARGKLRRVPMGDGTVLYSRAHGPKPPSQ